MWFHTISRNSILNASIAMNAMNAMNAIYEQVRTQNGHKVDVYVDYCLRQRACHVRGLARQTLSTQESS